jgi:hypothetical protein
MGGQVKIVDMDQMSDGEANSEADEDEDDVRMGNDDGADDAGALGVKGAEDDHEGELEAEETPRWGVVLVSEDGLEGAYCSITSCKGEADHKRRKSCLSKISYRYISMRCRRRQSRYGTSLLNSLFC